MRKQTFITSICRLVDHTVFTHNQIKFQRESDLEIREEMAFSALVTCRKSVWFLLVCLTSLAVSCPQGCQCSEQGSKVLVNCYQLNDLKSIPTASVPPATNILILQETQVSNIPQNAFTGLHNLERISVSENPLVSVAGDAFEGLTSLAYLFLDNNNLTQVSVDSLRGMTALIKFTASRNNLNTLPDGIFADTVNLRKLHLDHNKLTSVSSTLLTGLTKVDFLAMSNNMISDVSTTAFNSMASSLVHLNLDHNRLREFPFDSLQNFTALMELHLAYNDFQVIPSTAKTTFDKIAKRHGQMWISNNPLVCSQDLMWLQTWMKNNSAIVKDLDQVTCLTPYGNLSKVIDFDFSILDKWTIGELKATGMDATMPTKPSTMPSPLTSTTSPTASSTTRKTTSSIASSAASSMTEDTMSSTTSSTASSTTGRTTSSTTLPPTTVGRTTTTSSTQSSPITIKATTLIESLPDGDAVVMTTTPLPTTSPATLPPRTTASFKTTSSRMTKVILSPTPSTTAVTDPLGAATEESTDEAITSERPTALKKKKTASSSYLSVTPRSNVDTSAGTDEKETAGSTNTFFTRNQEVILSTSLIGLCVIVCVAIMLYFFKTKVSRRKQLSIRLPGMVYDKVDIV
ncbi:vasorin-like [Montipora foliosa]|uniref:vasorin-like n=1 Tax=Montipora foliosa TaxID=591990 RepID=UPI0035F1B415